MINTLFDAERYCSIATHDPEVIDRIIPILKKRHIQSLMYEFEMLYGIGTSQLNDLKKQGYPCRRYVVYGKEWYLYLCNRIAENPENFFSGTCGYYDIKEQPNLLLFFRKQNHVGFYVKVGSSLGIGYLKPNLRP